jgi:hypothetical protein
MEQVKFSEHYQNQIDNAKIEGIDSLGRVIISYPNGKESIPPKGKTAKQVLEAWVKLKSELKTEKLMVESFHGLTIEQIMEHPKYSHSRSRDYGVTFYAYSSSSPSGFCSVGGCSNDELNRVKKCLSPTEKR